MPYALSCQRLQLTAVTIGGLQFDIHAAGTTVYEAVEFSAQMRLMNVERGKMHEFIDQVRHVHHAILSLWLLALLNV